MEYNIEFVRSANDDLNYFDIFDQRIIIKGIFNYLQLDPNIETRKRKRLQNNPIGPWELRIGKYRIFYEFIEKQTVTILAIGYKEHNELFIRGEKVRI